MSKSRYVLIVTDGRAEAFTRIFGHNRVPVESTRMENAKLPRGGSQLVYKIDLQALTPDEQERLTSYLSELWDMPMDRVRAEIAARGVPIRAEGATLYDLDPEPDFA
jgi:hypothetical protein